MNPPPVPSRGTWRTAAIRVAAALAPIVFVCLVLLLQRWPEGVPRGAIVQITHSRGFEGQPSLSPDGRVVAYRCDTQGTGDICLTTIDAGRVVNLTSTPDEDESEPAFSPDGSTIAFRIGQRGIAIVPVAGGEIVKLSDAGVTPAWMPDGRAIVYSEEGGAARDVALLPAECWKVDVATRQKTRIAAADVHQPSVSPGGLRIAYWGRPVDAWNPRRLVGGRGDLWTVPVVGGSPVRVTNDPAVESSPFWSADGRYLYYIANRRGSSAIWRIAIDERTGRTSGLPETVQTPYSQPAFATRSADGSRLAWSDAHPVEKVVRMVFDADARKTRGSPVEIRPGDPAWEGADAPSELRMSDWGARSGGTRSPVEGSGFPGYWSHDRRLFAGTASGSVWIYSADTQVYTPLRAGEDPVWLRDGRRLVFSSSGRLFIADGVLKISRELLSLEGQHIATPRLSQDNRFLYFSLNGTDANLWVMTIANAK